MSIGIVNALKKTLEEMKLNLQNLIAIGSDNASVIEINNGVYAKLKAEVSSLILIKCICHSTCHVTCCDRYFPAKSRVFNSRDL